MKAPSTSHFVRLYIVRLLVVGCLILLAVRSWNVQVANGSRWRTTADQNRFRTQQIQAPRGVIYDKTGQILVRNRPSFVISVIPSDLPRDTEVAESVVGLLLNQIGKSQKWEPLPAQTGVWYPATRSESCPDHMPDHPSVGQVMACVDVALQGGAFQPVVVAHNVDSALAFRLQEESLSWPGVRVDVEPLRQYLSGPLTSHLIGYMGPVPEEQKDHYQALGYTSGDTTGLTGIEASYESILRGTKGSRTLEVNVSGREVRAIGSQIDPQPGHNLVLNIDLRLQAVMETALKAGIDRAYKATPASAKVKPQRGIAIAMDPRNGAIMGMVSWPTFDNNLFSAGITQKDYQQLLDDQRHPLLDLGLSGWFPPGSTFKIIPAAAALQEKVMTEESKIVDNTGVIYLPNKLRPNDASLAVPFYDWMYLSYHHGHGPLTLVGALTESCDICFYEIAGGYQSFQGLNEDRLAKYAGLFGLGSPTGIDLPDEYVPSVPTPKWKRLNWNEAWFTGDSYNMGIGQGFVLVTPLQMLNATAAIANNGTLWHPQVVNRITDADGKTVREFQPQAIRDLPIDKHYLDIVRQGLWGAVNASDGTAPDAKIAGVTVAGKTGTAEFGLPDSTGKKQAHAWFTAFAPYEAPEIALVVMVEAGNEGAQIAVPIAHDILQQYFDQIRGH